jgi:hypothetical protein
MFMYNEEVRVKNEAILSIFLVGCNWNDTSWLFWDRASPEEGKIRIGQQTNYYSPLDPVLFIDTWGRSGFRKKKKGNNKNSGNVKEIQLSEHAIDKQQKYRSNKNVTQTVYPYVWGR